jgi:hypothetical protein
MATVIPFPLARRISQNVAHIAPATVVGWPPPDMLGGFPAQPYGPIIDLLSPDTDTDGTALPCDVEPPAKA